MKELLGTDFRQFLHLTRRLFLMTISPILLSRTRLLCRHVPRLPLPLLLLPFFLRLGSSLCATIHTIALNCFFIRAPTTPSRRRPWNPSRAIASHAASTRAPSISKTRRIWATSGADRKSTLENAAASSENAWPDRRETRGENENTMVQNRKKKTQPT